MCGSFRGPSPNTMQVACTFKRTVWEGGPPSRCPRTVNIFPVFRSLHSPGVRVCGAVVTRATGWALKHRHVFSHCLEARSLRSRSWGWLPEALRGNLFWAPFSASGGSWHSVVFLGLQTCCPNPCLHLPRTFLLCHGLPAPLLSAGLLLPLAQGHQSLGSGPARLQGDPS